MGHGPAIGFSHFDPSNAFSNFFSRRGLSSVTIFIFLSLLGLDIDFKTLVHSIISNSRSENQTSITANHALE